MADDSRSRAGVSKAAVTFAYEAAGSHGLQNPSRLQRCFRDIHAGTQHFFAGNAGTLDFARDVLTNASGQALENS